jgi:hypothetical protein
MHEDPFDGCEIWDLTSVESPQRSTLYALEPIGLGTPLVESLTSYITRLAEAHCIFSGLLVGKMIAPLVPGYSPDEKQQGLFADAGARSNLFNGIGLPATYVVQALSTLTLRTDLRYLTCLPLAAILPGRAKNVLHLYKAWCPLCYEQRRMEGQVLYDPLLWTFQEITHCVFHQRRLSTCCPYGDCGRSLFGISWRSRVGYCSYCQRWLGLPSPQREESPLAQDADWLWQKWVTDALGTTLAALPTQSVLLDRGRICQVVRYVVQYISAGKISELSAFARSIRMSRNMIDYWYQGKNVPQFHMLLQFCSRLQLTLHDFLFQEIDTLRPYLGDSESLPIITPRKKPLVQVEKIYQALERIVADNEQPPPSLRTIGRRIGYTSQVLSRCHPPACREIVQRYNTYVQQRKEARLRRVQEEIQQAVLQLRSQGLPLSQKRISPFLSQPGVLRNPQVCAFLREILAG